MPKQDQEFIKKLQATFQAEAQEHLQAMSSMLLELEKSTASDQWAAIVEKIFRETHSLKGASRAVNLLEIEPLCQSLENVFAAMKADRLTLSPEVFDQLHQAIDAMGDMLFPDTPSKGVTQQPVIETLIGILDDVLKRPPPASEQQSPAEPKQQAPPSPTQPQPDSTLTADPRMPHPSFGASSETVRVSTAKLDAVMRQVEELLVPRLAASQRTRELLETMATLAHWKKQRVQIQPSLRVVERSLERGHNPTANDKPQELVKLLEYLEAETLILKTIETQLARLKKSAEHDYRSLTAMTENLLQDVKQMHLLPFSSLLESFPLFVRGIGRAQGKELDLVIRGSEIEIDRRILQEMKDPLIHMLRNCVDHGIEEPAVRRHKHKPPHGTISLTVSQTDSGKVEIVVADDGAGIDVAKVKATACKQGIISAKDAQNLNEAEAMALVFRSGFSTSPIITDISGRGLGLAIVREKITRLGGVITLESGPQSGTSFRIVLPLTLTTFRGVLVRVGEQPCVIPAVNVEHVTRVAQPSIRMVETRETIRLGEQMVSLVWLSDALELPRRIADGQPHDHVQVVVLSLGKTRIAFRVDEVIGEQEVLVKPLGRQLARVRNVAGATVLGTGRLAPVLSVSDLLKSAVKTAAKPAQPAIDEKPTDSNKRSILVVEDSITSRALLKNILESAGYQVTTAVDGIEAYTALKTEMFDLVVSDVDMPRMNGFDLTAKIRSDKHLPDLPIILVTSLDSREHRERGIDVGANAYIVKSSFDQSNLLEVVHRLI